MWGNQDRWFHGTVPLITGCWSQHTGLVVEVDNELWHVDIQRSGLRMLPLRKVLSTWRGRKVSIVPSMVPIDYEAHVKPHLDKRHRYDYAFGLVPSFMYRRSRRNCITLVGDVYREAGYDLRLSGRTGLCQLETMVQETYHVA